jgi:hypothetical protein
MRYRIIHNRHCAQSALAPPNNQPRFCGDCSRVSILRAIPTSSDLPQAEASKLRRADALTEIDRFFRQTKRVIIPLTVQEILDERIAQKLA